MKGPLIAAMFLGALGGFMGGLLAPREPAMPTHLAVQAVRTEQLEVVDGAGRVMLSVRRPAPALPGPEIVLFDDSKRMRMSLHLNGVGQPAIQLYDEAGSAVARLWAIMDNPELQILGEDGLLAASVDAGGVHHFRD